MNTMLSSSRTPRFSLYIPLALLAAVIAIAGFWRTYFAALFAGRSQADWFAHVHTVVFMGWIALVAFQAWLAMKGKIALHRKVGRIGMAFGVLLVVVGLSFALVRFTHRVATLGPDKMTGALLAPLTDMLTFAIFLAGAWFTRAKPEFHRRFILLATTTILIAAVGRLSGGTASVAARDVIPFLAVWLSPLWVAILYDAWKHRILHPVYALGALLLVALRYRQLFRETDTWMGISRAFAHWVAKHLT